MITTVFLPGGGNAASTNVLGENIVKTIALTTEIATFRSKKTALETSVRQKLGLYNLGIADIVMTVTI